MQIRSVNYSFSYADKKEKVKIYLVHEKLLNERRDAVHSVLLKGLGSPFDLKNLL